jgi:FkbM family methyltransferase
MPSGRPSLARRLTRLVRDAPYRKSLQVRRLTQALAKANPDAKLIGIEESGGVTFLHVADSIITPTYITYGQFQRDELDKLIRWCDELGLPLGGAFLDVGANIGTSTLDAIRSGRFERAVAIEPAPGNVRVIELNVLANGLTDRVAVLPVACSGAPGTVDLWLTEGNQGDHRLGDGGVAPSTHGRSIKVETVTLDQAVAQAGLQPGGVSLAWVDTQGHEPGVLEGASALIDAGVPFAIEFWPGGYRRAGTLDQLLDLIEERFDQFADQAHPELRLRPTSEVRALATQFEDLGQTDLFLVPRTGG